MWPTLCGLVIPSGPLPASLGFRSRSFVATTNCVGTRSWLRQYPVGLFRSTSAGSKNNQKEELNLLREGVMNLPRSFVVGVIGLWSCLRPVRRSLAEHRGSALKAAEGGPDLIVNSISGPAVGRVGGLLAVSFIARNVGDDNASAFKVGSIYPRIPGSSPPRTGS